MMRGEVRGKALLRASGTGAGWCLDLKRKRFSCSKVALPVPNSKCKASRCLVIELKSLLRLL